MKRYHEEKHIIERRRKDERRIVGYNLPKSGRFRKRNVFDHGPCVMCQFERIYGIPTHKQIRDDLSAKEQME